MTERELPTAGPYGGIVDPGHADAARAQSAVQPAIFNPAQML